MTERVVNTYNVFVDSSTGRDNNSKGDNYHLHLGNAGISHHLRGWAVLGLGRTAVFRFTALSCYTYR